MARILLVDDNANNLRAFERALRASGYHITTFDSPAAALDYARGCDVDLVISDYLMPEMDGIEFLREFRRLKPQAGRIVLSGYCERDALYGAINEGGVLRYIEKPCDTEVLRRIIAQVLDERVAVCGLINHVT